MEFIIETIPIIPHIGVVFPLFGWLSFLFLGEFEGNTNISVAVKSGSTVGRRDLDFEINLHDSNKGGNLVRYMKNELSRIYV